MLVNVLADKWLNASLFLGRGMRHKSARCGISAANPITSPSMLANVSFSKMATKRAFANVEAESVVLYSDGTTHITYNPQKTLGGGSFGKIFSGFASNTEPELEYDVCIAVKRCRTGDVEEEALEQFNQEIKVLEHMPSHPNIIDYFGHINTSILFERGDRDLDEFLRFMAPLATQQKYDIMQNIAAAIKYMNDWRVVHCDLKPSNIIMFGTTPKICDFGSSHIDGDAPLMYGGLCTSEYRAPDILCYENNKLVPGQYSSAMMVWSFSFILIQVWNHTPRTILFNPEKSLDAYETKIRCQIYSLLCGRGYPADSYQLQRMQEYATSIEGRQFRDNTMRMLIRMPICIADAIVSMWKFDNKQRPTISKVVAMLGTVESWE